MYKVTTEDGTEVDAYSQEELDALAAEKIEAEKARIEAETAAEKEAWEIERTELQEKLEKELNKEKNFELARKSAGKLTDETTKALQEQIAGLTEKIEKIAAQPKNDVKEDFLRNNLGDDKEKRERFEYYYKKLGADATNKEEVLKASAEALALATGGDFKPDFNSGMLGVGASLNYRNTAPTEVSEESKEIGRALGVTDEDRKKYGGKK